MWSKEEISTDKNLQQDNSRCDFEENVNRRLNDRKLTGLCSYITNIYLFTVVK